MLSFVVTTDPHARFGCKGKDAFVVLVCRNHHAVELWAPLERSGRSAGPFNRRVGKNT
jgi:hypothetical protein